MGPFHFHVTCRFSFSSVWWQQPSGIHCLLCTCFATKLTFLKQNLHIYFLCVAQAMDFGSRPKQIDRGLRRRGRGKPRALSPQMVLQVSQTVLQISQRVLQVSQRHRTQSRGRRSSKSPHTPHQGAAGSTPNSHSNV